jgi:transcriptional regulator with XRE-family HTH domain
MSVVTTASVDTPQTDTPLLRQALGETLRRVRASRQRTLRDVAADARVSLGYLSEIERGRKEASSELIAAVCEALGVPLSAVLVDVGRTLARDERRNVAPVAPARAASASAGLVDRSTRIVIPAPQRRYAAA